ncbi:VCBS repeat-containing protein [Streptomyces sp. ISL-98]|uniref:FG-GAP and VCBS repeat-containing protein n=1 Tax=Streptomyces sp. ISL-98 TaxID=2819192 RepID=UPI001BEB452A|nr:FG-GAP and VCBS repeat-containing protein [Streptomyces sp. ISL-98]MBT2507527.1 VCBS repeat-containing protein [Streptomyces sp. ISL-98]
MRKHPRAAALAATLLAAALTPLTLPAATASAAPAKLSDDFNGDGYRDLAISADGHHVGSADNAGAVVVLYGSSSGITSTARRTVITQNSSGVPGTAESMDRFGNSLSSADLNEDGYADLVVAAVWEGTADKPFRGSLTVLWGSSTGITGTGSANLPVPSYVPDNAYFGSGTATGDFNGDGHQDVTATGQDHTRTYYGPFTKAGVPVGQRAEAEGSTYTAIAGDLSGDGAAERLYPFNTDNDLGGWIRYHRWTGTQNSITTMSNTDGDAGATGDINKDGYGDLVLGDVSGPNTAKGGRITVWYGGPTGPDPAQKPTIVHQDTAGVPGGGEDGDGFGATIAVGDANGDGYADVVVGAPGEALGTKRNAGSVTVLYGSATGLTTTGAKTFTQDTAGVPGGAESYDSFGSSVRLRDLNKDGRAELTVGAPLENSYGSVTVLPGSTTGTTTTRSVSLTARDAGLAGSASFGAALAN